MDQDCAELGTVHIQCMVYMPRLLGDNGSNPGYSSLSPNRAALSFPADETLLYTGNESRIPSNQNWLMPVALTSMGAEFDQCPALLKNLTALLARVRVPSTNILASSQ